MPSDWHPNLEHARIATALGVDFELELAKFRDHYFRDPRSDADATFRNWLRNARPGNGSRASPRAFNRAQDTLDRQLERVRQLQAEEALEAAERAAKI
ncbi:MAG: hypothetical protein AMXMBFR56_73510 [Polyangiaceae bacterium]